MNSFIGTWAGPDEYTTEVEYTVSLIGDRVSVSAVDPSDGETAEVSDIRSGADRLEFNARWPSTGRMCACIFKMAEDDRIELTFTYTDKTLLVRR